MLKLKLASALLAATFVSAGSVYAAGVIPSEGDSGGLSIRPLPQDTRATPPVGFPTGVSEIGNMSQEQQTEKAMPGIVAAGGHSLDFGSFPDGTRSGPAGSE